MAMSDLAIRTAKPSDKPYKLFDSGGLFLLVAVSGSKLWRLKYRHGGKEKLLAIGAYAIVGSSNFTRRGLGLSETPNIELNLIVDSDRDRSDLKDWFEGIWNDESLVPTSPRSLSMKAFMARYRSHCETTLILTPSPAISALNMATFSLTAPGTFMGAGERGGIRTGRCNV